MNCWINKACHSSCTKICFHFFVVCFYVQQLLSWCIYPTLGSLEGEPLRVFTGSKCRLNSFGGLFKCCTSKPLNSCLLGSWRFPLVRHLLFTLISLWKFVHDLSFSVRVLLPKPYYAYVQLLIDLCVCNGDWFKLKRMKIETMKKETLKFKTNEAYLAF